MYASAGDSGNFDWIAAGARLISLNCQVSAGFTSPSSKMAAGRLVSGHSNCRRPASRCRFLSYCAAFKFLTSQLPTTHPAHRNVERLNPDDDSKTPGRLSVLIRAVSRRSPDWLHLAYV